jgi:trafficking protein particle complex subunit 6
MSSKLSSVQVASSSMELLLFEYISQCIKTTDSSRSQHELLVTKLELLGYNIGKRYCERQIKDREKFNDVLLDCFKWICQTFWVDMFHKPIDRLQTNNRGIFILQDLNFKFLKNLSTDSVKSDEVKHQQMLFCLPVCGYIRGILSSFGYNASVNISLANLPSVTFHVRIL